MGVVDQIVASWFSSIDLSNKAIEFCHEEIESGDLEVIELEYEPKDLVLYAFYASRKHLAKKIPAFIEHLKRQANNETSG